MSRRATLWALIAPLLLAGSLLAHETAYLIAVPDAAVRDAELEASGHQYLEHAPLVLGIGGVLALAMLVFHAARWGGRSRSPLLERRILAALPLVAFPVQELLERLFSTGALDLSFPAERAFLFGLALQIPFALAALALARWLLRAAELVGRALAPLVEIRPERHAPPRPRYALEPVRVRVLASRHAGRAPPPTR